MKNFFSALILSLLFITACENPKSPASQFLFQFEKTVKSGTQDAFEKMLLVDPREESEKITPQLIGDVDGSKAPLKDSKNVLSNYLANRKIDYTKTTALVEYGKDFSVKNANGSVSEFKVKTYSLKNSDGKIIASIDLWDISSNKFSIGNVSIQEILP